MKYNLVIVIGEFLELEIKDVQPGDKLRFRRVAFNDNELLGEDAFYDKPAAVMLQSCLAKQFVEMNMLRFVIGIYSDELNYLHEKKNNRRPF